MTAVQTVPSANNDEGNIKEAVKAMWQKAASQLHMDGIHYTSQLAAPSPLKIAHSHGGSGLPSNTWFLEPTWIHNQRAS